MGELEVTLHLVCYKVKKFEFLHKSFTLGKAFRTGLNVDSHQSFQRNENTTNVLQVYTKKSGGVEQNIAKRREVSRGVVSGSH